MLRSDVSDNKEKLVKVLNSGDPTPFNISTKSSNNKSKQNSDHIFRINTAYNQSRLSGASLVQCNETSCYFKRGNVSVHSDQMYFQNFVNNCGYHSIMLDNNHGTSLQKPCINDFSIEKDLFHMQSLPNVSRHNLDVTFIFQNPFKHVSTI